MGFGAAEGALGEIFSFGFPRITVGIGRPIPAPTGPGDRRPRKDELNAYTERVLDAVERLIPEHFRRHSEAPER